VRRTCACHGAHGTGCADCGGSGFYGRLALVEVLNGSPEFEKRVAAGESTERIAEAARVDGMRTLWKSGLLHTASGRTTLEEVLRVATPDDEPRVVPEPNQARMDVAPRSLFDDDAFLTRANADASCARPRRRGRIFPGMTQVRVGTVDAFVIRPLADGWQVLALQRGTNTRCPSAWEPVHGHIEPGEEPEDAAVREVREETGLDVERLYVVRVQPFYLRKIRTVELAIVFAAFVAETGEVVTGSEHQRAEWLSVDEALLQFAFPAERASLREIVELLSTGDAGPVDDVMRVF